jgi:hypothetical protein
MDRYGLARDSWIICRSYRDLWRIFRCSVGNLAMAGDVMIGFLHGLKTGELKPLQLEQVTDILARFDSKEGEMQTARHRSSASFCSDKEY